VGRINYLAGEREHPVHEDASFGDEAIGLAPRGDTGPRERALDAHRARVGGGANRVRIRSRRTAPSATNRPPTGGTTALCATAACATAACATAIDVVAGDTVTTGTVTTGTATIGTATASSAIPSTTAAGAAR
jgi:hypothetical protein